MAASAFAEPADCSACDGVACTADWRLGEPDGIVLVEVAELAGLRIPCAFERGLPELGVAEVALLEPLDCSPIDGVLWTAARLLAGGTAVIDPIDPPLPAREREALGVPEPAVSAPDDCSDWDGVLCEAV